MGQAKAVTGKCCIRAEAMGGQARKKVPFHAGFRKGRCIPANEQTSSKRANFGYVLMYSVGLVPTDAGGL